MRGLERSKGKGCIYNPLPVAPVQDPDTIQRILVLNCYIVDSVSGFFPVLFKPRSGLTATSIPFLVQAIQVRLCPFYARPFNYLGLAAELTLTHHNADAVPFLLQRLRAYYNVGIQTMSVRFVSLANSGYFSGLSRLSRLGGMCGIDIVG